ncbi:MAG: hypothetical protein ABIJ37_07385 [Pseudomonadota bacterium]
MRIKLDENAIENSVYGIAVSFLDSDNNPATPKTLTWSLTDGGGIVINSRKDVVVADPESTENIILKGDDLQMQDSNSTRELRLLLVSGTYDDAVLGADCPVREEISFFVKNYVEPLDPA